MTPAAGVLSCIAAHSEAARELVFAARPAVLPPLLNALSLGSPSLTASAVGAQPLDTPQHPSTPLTNPQPLKPFQTAYVFLVSGAAAAVIDLHADF